VYKWANHSHLPPLGLSPLPCPAAFGTALQGRASCITAGSGNLGLRGCVLLGCDGMDSIQTAVTSAMPQALRKEATMSLTGAEHEPQRVTKNGTEDRRVAPSETMDGGVTLKRTHGYAVSKSQPTGMLCPSASSLLST
jgi:hypothetical protein